MTQCALYEMAYDKFVEFLEENSYKKGNKTLTCKEFLIMDPDGYLLRFSEDIQN